MAELKISVEMPSAAAIMALVYAKALPRLGQAVRAVAQQTAADWVEAVQRAKLWSGEKDAYAASIQWQMTGAFSAEVASNYRYAEEIENGRPARDLKKMLDTSLKTRLSKKGKRYLIIPFRHQTPGHAALGPSMPQHVYNVARKLKPSTVIGQKQRLSGTGASDVKTRRLLTVNQNVYTWGDQLGAGMMGPNPKGKADRFAGMVRFSTTSPGGKKSSTYMTFRVMTEDSKGWIIPPRPGLYIVRQVVQRMQPLAQRVFGEAVRRDVAL